MRLEDFLSALNNVAQQGSQYYASCPAHEDKGLLFMAGGDEIQRAALGIGTRYPASVEVNPDDLRVRKAGVDITDECRLYTHRERTHTLHLLYHNGGIASSWVEGYKIEVLDGKA